MANKSYAILPCNGLDKCAGGITKEVALLVAEKTDSEILCPVFYRISDTKYNRLAEEKSLLVIDGCATRCASKLAAEKGLKISERITITEEAKSLNVDVAGHLRLNDADIAFARALSEKLLNIKETNGQEGNAFELVCKNIEYTEYVKDKFVFRIPNNAGFYFNENDVWAFVSGNKARIGVTSYIESSLSDILFFTPGTIGSAVEQFGEVGNIESSKAVFEIISPVSGTITAVNGKLVNSPELINQSPYEDGWIAELELSDFESDRELLHDFNNYFPIMKKKVDEFHS